MSRISIGFGSKLNSGRQLGVKIMSEEKIVELEEKIAFLQNMIDELNMVVFRQGNKLEKLNLELKDTKEKLLNQSESASNNTKDLDDRPPHY